MTHPKKKTTRGGARPGAGRKKLEQRKAQRTVYLLPEVWMEIEAAAAAAEVSLSDYIAMRLGYDINAAGHG